MHEIWEYALVGALEKEALWLQENLAHGYAKIKELAEREG